MRIQIVKANDIRTLNQCIEIRRLVFTVEQNIPKDIEIDEYDTLNQKCDHYLVKYRAVPYQN